MGVSLVGSNPARSGFCQEQGDKRLQNGEVEKKTTRMGFEPTRAEHIGLAVQRLNHSATSS